MEKSHIPYAETGFYSRLMLDYLQGDEQLKSLCSVPFEPEALSSHLEQFPADAVDRRLLVEGLKAQYAGLGMAGRRDELIDSLARTTTFTITTAHQPCLFGGPMYFHIKIACAIRLARQLKKSYPKYDFVPVYWMGSEDHDFEEVNHAYFFGQEWRWERESGGPVGRMSMDKSAELLAEVEERIGPDNWMSGRFSEWYGKSATFGEATFRMVENLFGDEGLLVIDQDDRRFKAAFREVMRDELLDPKSSSLIAGNLEFLTANYHQQAHTRDINLFYLTDDARERIERDEQGFRCVGSERRFSETEILEELESNPERFSPNVILRPLYQESILPNACFVGGGGETAYWLQLKPIFDHYGKPFPQLVLRSSLMFISTGQQKKIRKHQLMDADLFKPLDTILKARAAQQLGDFELEAERSELMNTYSRISERLAAVEPTLKQSTDAELQKALKGIGVLEQKMIRAQKRNDETAVNQLKALYEKLFPAGKLQERYENYLPWLMRYGQEAIPMLIDCCDPYSKQFIIVKE